MAGNSVPRSPRVPPEGKIPQISCRKPRTVNFSITPGRRLERCFEGSSIVDRLAVRDEDTLEGKVEHLSKRRQHPLLIPGRLPDPQEPVGGGHAVGKDQGPLLGKVERRLHRFATVVQGYQPSR